MTKLRIPFSTYLLLFLSCLIASPLTGQRISNVQNTDPAILISAGYGPQTPAGDLGDRFGNGFGIEMALDYTGKESPWIFGLMGQYSFGSEVFDDVIEGLRTREGFIIGNQRDPADIQLRMRAFFAGARVSRIIPLGSNPRAGIRISLGGGWMEHRIRIQNDVSQTVNQLTGDYRKGYDRLTGGPAAYQFIGYQQLSQNGRINFYVGGEIFEGFTTGKRDFDFATGTSLDDSRLDILAGLRVGLILPLYQGEGKEIFYR